MRNHPQANANALTLSRPKANARSARQRACYNYVVCTARTPPAEKTDQQPATPTPSVSARWHVCEASLAHVYRAPCSAKQPLVAAPCRICRRASPRLAPQTETRPLAPRGHGGQPTRCAHTIGRVAGATQSCAGGVRRVCAGATGCGDACATVAVAITAGRLDVEASTGARRGVMFTAQAAALATGGVAGGGGGGSRSNS